MRTIRRMTCLVAVLCLAPRSASAQDQDLTGLWRGTYNLPQGSEKATKFIGFTMLVLQRGDDVSGLILESNTFGEESAPNLHATFKGRYDQNTRELSFAKTYDGTGGQDHEVQYRGDLAEDGASAAGKWQTNADWGGEFKLTRIPMTGGGPAAGLWTGHYHYPEGSGQEPVKFSMYVVHKGTRLAGFIKETKTFGEGNDPWLHATISGKISPLTGEMTFTKTYDGTGNQWHDIEYTGRYSEAGQTMIGRWEISPQFGGKFALVKSAQP